MVLDAGTEVNDELPADTAFFGQTTPNTGTDENGRIRLHGGYNPIGSGRILDDHRFRHADFTAAGCPVAQIRVELVPIPATVWLLGFALIGLVGLRKRLKN